MSLAIIRSVDRSNMPHHEKGAITKWVEDTMQKHGVRMTTASAKSHVQATVNAIHQGGASVIVGGGLGALNAMLPTGLDVKGAPIDLGIGVAGLLGSVALANEPYASGMANAGSVALGVFSFRKMDAVVRKKRGMKAGVHGEFGEEASGGEDPIIAAARNLR
jgi:hypothetical protein